MYSGINCFSAWPWCDHFQEKQCIFLISNNSNTFKLSSWRKPVCSTVWDSDLTLKEAAKLMINVNLALSSNNNKKIHERATLSEWQVHVLYSLKTKLCAFLFELSLISVLFLTYEELFLFYLNYIWMQPYIADKTANSLWTQAKQTWRTVCLK